MTSRPKPIVLTILDGWGHNPSPQDNAIQAAHTPHWDHWWQTAPRCLLEASGQAVGLPPSQMGNSEVGHMHIGAGQAVPQDLTLIHQAIETGDFFKNDILCSVMQSTIEQNNAIHVIGLLSPGGIHSHQEHCEALITLASQFGAPKLFIHAILDGRDTPPKSAQAYLSRLQSHCAHLGCGQIASIMGRFYAMDRDHRWDRTQKAYDALVSDHPNHSSETVEEALMSAYARGETDEFVFPTRIQRAPPMVDGDSLIFFNFRADRARQLTRAFLENTPPFQKNKSIKLAHFASFKQYDPEFETQVVFGPPKLKEVLGACIANAGLSQLRIAETEKYAHVTFFFNGGIETPFENETRILIPSPKVTTYDQQPEMSAPALTDQLCDAIQSQQYDVIICNYANADMVGHTGNFDATLKAIHCLDTCLGQIHETLQSVGGEMLITADHGNAECMFDPTTGQTHTAHTSYPVPLIYLGRCATMRQDLGTLCDIAPTLLTLLGLPIPTAMTGQNLITLT